MRKELERFTVPEKIPSSLPSRFLCLAVVDTAQILMPQFIRRAVDTIASGSYAMPEVLRWCAALIGVAFILSLGRFFWRYYIHGSSRAIETELRDRLFGHLMNLSAGFLPEAEDRRFDGRATNDLNAVRMSIGMAS
jgi:ATP-binding cassette subfamily B protein